MNCWEVKRNRFVTKAWFCKEREKRNLSPRFTGHWRANQSEPAQWKILLKVESLKEAVRKSLERWIQTQECDHALDIGVVRLLQPWFSFFLFFFLVFFNHANKINGKPNTGLITQIKLELHCKKRLTQNTKTTICVRANICAWSLTNFAWMQRKKTNV